MKRAVDPATRARMYAASLAYVQEHSRYPCKGGCGRLVWLVGKTARENRSGYCAECLGKITCQTARDGLLLCARCGEWKPDDAFPKRTRAKARRGRATMCRPCDTAARRDYRNRVKVPCSRCGEPCLPASERKPSAARQGLQTSDLCIRCWRETEFPKHRDKAIAASIATRRAR